MAINAGAVVLMGLVVLGQARAEGGESKNTRCPQGTSYALVTGVGKTDAKTFTVEGRVRQLDKAGVEKGKAAPESVSALLFLVSEIPAGGLSVADSTSFGGKVESDGRFLATAPNSGVWALVVIAAGYCPVTVMTKVPVVVEVYMRPLKGD
jgi:hypothetical protein